jgi:transcriptional regulator with XRE-family HTH domain
MNTEERLLRLRKNLLHMTQAEFSNVIGISRSNYSNIEKGNIGIASRVVRDVCREFSVRKEWLLEGEEPVFEEVGESNNSVGALFNQLSEDNQKAIEIQIHHMLQEQKSLTAAFTGNGGANDDALSGEEIRLLREMLAGKNPGGR